MASLAADGINKRTRGGIRFFSHGIGNTIEPLYKNVVTDSLFLFFFVRICFSCAFYIADGRGLVDNMDRARWASKRHVTI